jgi:transposase
MNDFNENHLYQNLDWLSLNQEKIENKLYKLRYPDNTPNNIYLYDITSSYLEGEKNELSSFGYNRDKKTGKKQIVIGLLTDGDGVPLSVEVFDGNTSDSKTVSAQLTKIKKRFKGSNIVFVGDRGMLKSDQITDVYNHGYHYITGITKPQINKLIKEGVIDKTLFDVKLSEIESDGVRYILKLNPIRKEETEKVRESKYNKLLLKAKELNEYLKEHKKASLETAEKNIVEYAKKLKINDWIILEANEEAKIINLIKDLDALDKISELDGCYVLKTDLTKEMASKEVVHSRYKDLAKVETAFRRFKTTYLEVRPLFVRKESRTRGHVFIVMLAYILIKELENKWKYENVTLKEGIEELNQVSSLDIYISGKYSYSTIPKPKASTQKLLNLIDVSLPTGFLVNVDSKKNT